MILTLQWLTPTPKLELRNVKGTATGSIHKTHKLNPNK